MITTLSVRELQRFLQAGDLSAETLVSAFYDNIDKIEPSIKAFIYLKGREKVLDEARLIDQMRSRGAALPPFAGIPIGVKDNIAVADMQLTCGSRILKGFVPPYDATAVGRLRDAGLLFVGKSNMDEFGMGSSTENSAFFTTANPHNLEYVPGGTSGGSAAAVAAREVPIALGSDTGGSVRQPASFCGVVGLKPSYGRVSRYGLVAYASSLDQIGIIASNVLDAALLLRVIAGYDKSDSTTARIDVDNYASTAQQGRQRNGFAVGIPREYLDEGLDDSVRGCLDYCTDLLSHDGCRLIDVSLPHTKYALPAYYVIASSEASSNLARYDGIKYGFRAQDGSSFADLLERTRTTGFGAEVQRRIMLGTFTLSHGYKDQYYTQATRARQAITKDFSEAFGKCDILIHPVSPTPAWRIGEKVDDPLKMYLSDALSVPASLAGLPAIVIPCGSSTDGLPIGLQITSPHFQESVMLTFAFYMETLLHNNLYKHK